MPCSLFINEPPRGKTNNLHMRKQRRRSDQLRGYREADQYLCFRYTGGTIPLPPKSEISRSSHLLFWLKIKETLIPTPSIRF